MIPFTQISQKGEALHFAHANAYPLSCYRSFLSPFTEKYAVCGMHARPLWEESKSQKFNDWEEFGQDLIHCFEEQQLSNVIGVGHSMGAIYSLIAANKRPELFKKLILIDPVIIPQKAYKFTQFPYFLKKRMMPMVKIALRRKDSWDTKEEARAYFESKRFIQKFHPEAFEDFIEGGLKEKNGKFTLAFPKKWEGKIYSSVIDVWSILKRPPCPLIIIRGDNSNVISSEIWENIKRNTPNSTFINMTNVGHLIPMEKPKELAHIMLSQL